MKDTIEGNVVHLPVGNPEADSVVGVVLTREDIVEARLSGRSPWASVPVIGNLALQMEQAIDPARPPSELLEPPKYRSLMKAVRSVRADRAARQVP